MSSRDNTDVLRMMRDYADLINRNPFDRSSGNARSSAFSSALKYVSDNASDVRQRQPNVSGVATKLNFSNLSASSPYTSFASDESILSIERGNLKRKLLEKDAELQHTKAALNASKASLNAIEPNNKRICVELEAELERYKQLYEREKEHVDSLRHQLKFLIGQETELKHQVNEYRQQVDTTKADYEMKLKTWQKKYGQIKSEKEEFQTEKDDTIRELETEVARLQSDLILARQEAEQSKELAQSLKQQMQEKSRTISLAENLQKQLEELQWRVKELENEIEDNKEAALIARNTQSELERIPELTKENNQLKEENRMLRETNGNVMLLQEKVWSLQEQVSRAEIKNSSLAKLQVENEELQEHLAEWASLAGDDAPSCSPVAFSNRLSLMQKNEVILTEKLGIANAENKALQVLKDTLEKQVLTLKMELQQNIQSGSNKDALLKKLQRKLLLVSKERDSCRRVIDSYENEVTISGATMNSVHLQALQSLNADYKCSLEKLEEERDELQKEVDSFHQKQNGNICTTHDEEIEKLNNERKAQEIQMQQLQAENNVLHQRIQDLSQQMDNEKTKQEKIIHLRFNPLDQAVQKRAADIQQLKQENEQLKMRIKVLEEAGPSAHDVTVQVQKQIEQQPQVSIEDLKKQLLTSEKKNKRLMEAFRATSHELRDVCYRLTGYKITLPTQKKYCLSHMYAESPHDYLLFELTSDGSLHLLETDYSRCLGNLIDTYLQKGDSIPAFLSMLTLDLYNRQTCVIRQT